MTGDSRPSQGKSLIPSPTPPSNHQKQAFLPDDHALEQSKQISARVAFDGKVFSLGEELYKTWQEAFPAVDVTRAVQRAAAWAAANPANRKRNWERYLVNWLLREQERAPMGRRPSESLEDRAARYTESIRRMRREGKLG